MRISQPSDTYKLLYDYIIDDLLFQICTKTDYCVQYKKFKMKFPSIDKNICDIKGYKENPHNSLLWSHHNCNIAQKECFHYDIWAYAKIFYHLELYNKSFLNAAYQEFMDNQSF